MTTNEALETLFGEKADYVLKVTKAVDEILDLAKARGFDNLEALSVLGACVTNIIQTGAPSHDAAIRAAAGFSTALWGTLGVDVDFAVIAAEAKVDASKLN